MSSVPPVLRWCVAILALAALAAAMLAGFDLIYWAILAAVPEQAALPPRIVGAAAALFILLGLCLGIFLLEALGMSRLFPAIAQLPRRSRILVAWLSGGMLAILALVQGVMVHLVSLMPCCDYPAPPSRGTGLVQIGYQPENPVLWAMAFLLPFGLVLLVLVATRALTPMHGGQGGARHPGAAE